MSRKKDKEIVVITSTETSESVIESPTVQKVLSIETNAEALSVLSLEDNRYQLIMVPFNSETLESGKAVILAEEENFNEISDRFRIEAAKRDFA